MVASDNGVKCPRNLKKKDKVKSMEPTVDSRLVTSLHLHNHTVLEWLGKERRESTIDGYLYLL